MDTKPNRERDLKDIRRAMRKEQYDVVSYIRKRSPFEITKGDVVAIAFEIAEEKLQTGFSNTANRIIRQYKLANKNGLEVLIRQD